MMTAIGKLIRSRNIIPKKPVKTEPIPIFYSFTFISACAGAEW